MRIPLLLAATCLALTACNNSQTQEQNAAASDQASAAIAPLAQAVGDTATPAVATISASPSFDCTKATLKVETAICGSTQLAALDVETTRLYDLIGRSAGVDRGALQRLQGGWLNKRNACAAAADTTACLTEAYAGRINDLRAGYAVARADTAVSIGPVTWHCPNGDISSTFINTETSLVYVKAAGKAVVLTQAMSASGARYAAEGYEFWTKGNETMWTAPGAAMVTCTETK